MLHQVGYVRPLVPKKLVDSAKQNGLSPGNASSSVLARCFSMGSQTSIFSSEKQPQPYKEAPAGKILEILRVRNRFAMLKDEPHWSGGFRDLAFKVKVGFQVPAVDAASSSAFQTVSNLQRCTCRSRREERHSLFLCMTSCLHTAAADAVFAAQLTPFSLQEPLGRPLRQDLRLRAADPPPSE